jgi:bDLD-like protein
MLNLSPTMYNRCRDLLLRCTELESYENLRGVFVTEELRPFRYGIRNADSSAELVDLFFEYILDQNITSGKPAFLAFLAKLLTRYADGDDRRDELAKLLADIQAQEPPVPKNP